jgi:hypothetical protein
LKSLLTKGYREFKETPAESLFESLTLIEV